MDAELPAVDVADPAPVDPVADSIDGATGDWSVSGDAMRWSPELASRGPDAEPLTPLPGGPHVGLEVATGIGAVLGLDAAGMRRLVNGALTTITDVAGDVVSELRQLTRGPSSDDADR